MIAIILAGGRGSRLSEETDAIPKPMVRIGDQPILWHIIKHIAHYSLSEYGNRGIEDFVIAAGYRSDVIHDYFHSLISRGDAIYDLRDGRITDRYRARERIRVHVIDTGIETQTGGRLRQAVEYALGHTISNGLKMLKPDEPFLMTYGDGLSDVDIRELARFQAKVGGAVVTAVRPPARFGSLEVDGTRVAAFREKVLADNSWINGGYFILNSDVNALIGNNDAVWEEGPLQALVSHNLLNAYCHDGFWQCMDTLRDKRVLQELWASGHAPWAVWTQ